MRVYKIKQKSTGLYYTGVFWDHSKKRRKPNPRPVFEKTASFWQIYQVNYHVERLITDGFGAFLDDLEIEGFEVVDPQPVKSNIKLKNIRNRLEQKLIVNKLKSG